MIATATPQEIAPDVAALLSTAGGVGDPLKAILALPISLPSITFAGGDFEYPIIRGAESNDNLFLVDDIPVSGILHHLSDSIVFDRVVRIFDLHASRRPFVLVVLRAVSFI